MTAGVKATSLGYEVAAGRLHCRATFRLEEIADQRDDFIGLVLQGEVAGIYEMKLHVGQVTLVRMRPVGREDFVVLAPDD